MQILQFGGESQVNHILRIPVKNPIPEDDGLFLREWTFSQRMEHTCQAGSKRCHRATLSYAIDEGLRLWEVPRRKRMSL